MSFTRTPEGLTNMADFYGTAAVVLVEGKPQEDDNDPGSHDLLFWKQIFNLFAPTFAVKIRCMGSKSDLLDYASEVISGRVNNVIVAFDRDFDPELHQCLEHECILYTYGYSWENDAWSSDVIWRIVEQHSLIQPVPEEKCQEYKASYRILLRDLTRVARANLSAELSGEERVVTTDKHKALFVMRKGQYPSFNRDYFRSQIQAAKARRSAAITTRGLQLEPRKHCLGHAIAHLGYHILCATLSRLGHKAMLDFDLACSMACNAFGSLLSTNTDEATDHYRSAIHGIPGVT